MRKSTAAGSWFHTTYSRNRNKRRPPAPPLGRARLGESRALHLGERCVQRADRVRRAKLTPSSSVKSIFTLSALAKSIGRNRILTEHDGSSNARELDVGSTSRS